MNVIGTTPFRRRPHHRTVAVRLAAAALLAAVAFVPSLARTHDRLDQRTPAQQHSRFRWTNSCESVPQKTTHAAVVAAIDGPAQTLLQPPRPSWRPPQAFDVLLPAASPVVSPGALRAPPALA